MRVDEVRINKAQLEINAVKVGDKQLTQNLFNQLPVKVILNESTADLLGKPWGYVYFKGLYYILWQSEHLLYKMCLYSSEYIVECGRLTLKNEEDIFATFFENLHSIDNTEEFVSVEREYHLSMCVLGRLNQIFINA